MTKILDSLSSNFVTIETKGVGGKRPSAAIDGAGEILAAHFGGEAKLMKGSTRDAFPSPYGDKFKALVKAHGAYRTQFYKLTTPFEFTTNVDTGQLKADGPRLLAAQFLANGEFYNTLNKLEAELDQARAACAATIDQDVADLEAACRSGLKIGGTFKRKNYPSKSDILAGWSYTLSTPTPIVDGSQLRRMSIPISMVTAIEAQLEAVAASQIRFGQSQLAKELLGYVKTTAENLSKLDQWFTSQKGKRPAIHDSLVTNLQDSLIKLRTYAVPNTEEGEKLLALADEIETRLGVGSLKADDFKTDHAATRRTAKEADKLSRDIESALDDLFAEGGRPPVKLADPPAVVDLEPVEPPTPASNSDVDFTTMVAHTDQQATLHAVQAEMSDLDALLEEWA
jgi:hypothetical protein